MYEDQTHHQYVPHGWMQHHLPWLAVFAFVFGLISDDDRQERGSDAFYG